MGEIRSRRVRFVLTAVLALTFFAGHVGMLPASVEDIDSVNFALALRDFDVAQHQPHAPGYPVYVAFTKAIDSLLRVLPGGDARTVREAHALALCGILFGALAAFPLVQFYRCLERHDDRSVAAAALSLGAPLMWFTASRPLSDVTGLAAALAAMAFLATAFQRQGPASDHEEAGWQDDAARQIASGRMIVAGALAAGVAIGFRSQNVWLTLPLLALVIGDRAGKGAAGAVLGSAMTFTIGALVWVVPLLVATGGPARYAGLVANQATEDLAGVDMLYRSPTFRRLAVALWQTLVMPWVSPVLAAVVLALAATGLIVLLRRNRRAAVLLVGSFGAYGLFHLAFQETVTLRYALPIVPAVAYLAVRALDAASPRLLWPGVAALLTVSLAFTVPALARYAAMESPTFQALSGVRSKRASERTGEPVVAMHYDYARALRGEDLGLARLPVPPRAEWREVAAYWAGGGEAPVWFLANPLRTDLAFVDPASRVLVEAFRWPFAPDVFLGGVRPGAVDWYAIERPGWFVTDGWALTPELAGVAMRAGRGPSIGPIEARVRRRPDETTVMIGGRHLGHPGDPDVRFQLTIDERPAASWTASPEPGFFLEFLTLEPGRLAGSGPFARVVLTSASADGSSRAVATAIEQFDLREATALVWGFGPGWHEQEYNPATGRLWRWTSQSADLVLKGPAGDVAVAIRGDSPPEWFDGPPTVELRAGSTVLARASPTTDFELEATVSSAVLRAAEGRVTLTVDRVFVPADRSRSPDRRQLGLRIAGVTVRPAF